MSQFYFPKSINDRSLSHFSLEVFTLDDMFIQIWERRGVLQHWRLFYVFFVLLSVKQETTDSVRNNHLVSISQRQLHLIIIFAVLDFTYSLFMSATMGISKVPNVSKQFTEMIPVSAKLEWRIEHVSIFVYLGR